MHRELCAKITVDVHLMNESVPRFCVMSVEVII